MIKVKNIVIPCAGRGLRSGAVCQPKSLLEIKSKSILQHIIEYWKDWCLEFVVIVPKEDKNIEKLLTATGINHKIVFQEEPNGVANALLCAEKYVQENFIVVLGDCLLLGDFSFFNESPFPGIGIWKGADSYATVSNYGVLISENKIIKVEEKPQNAVNYHCGMGVYFFNKDIFGMIRNMPSADEKKEITALVSECINKAYGLKPVYFGGQYFNVNTLHDLERVKKYYETKI